jgi:hypothetical protein
MDLDPDKLEQFFDATEEWNSSINMSNRYVEYQSMVIFDESAVMMESALL